MSLNKFLMFIAYCDICNFWKNLPLILSPYFSIDNLCENALDLNNGILIVNSGLPYIECQWLIAATDETQYVVMEFQNINVRDSNYRIEVDIPDISYIETWQ